MQLDIGIDEASGTFGERMAKRAQHSLRSGFAGGHHPRRAHSSSQPHFVIWAFRNYERDLANAHTSKERLKQRLLHT